MYLWAVGNFVSSIYGGPNGKILNFQDYSAGAPVTCFALTGADTFLTVRIQKNTAGSVSMQVWDATGAQIAVYCGSSPQRSSADDLSGATSSIGMSGHNIGGAYSDNYAGAIAFFRLFSTVSASQDSPGETSGPGDLLNLDFEQTIAESHGIPIVPLPENASFSYVPSMPAAAPVSFSLPGGVYGSAQTLTISSAAPGMKYTTDNTDPTSSGTAQTVQGGKVALTIGKTQTVSAYTFGPGIVASSPTAVTYTITPLPVLAAPVFSPLAGKYTGSQSVTISAPGDWMKYTVDNSDPTVSPTAQIAMSRTTISVSSSETIKAYAYAPGYQPSPTASAAYSIVSTTPTSNLPVLSAPVLNPPGGTYASSQSVTISAPGDWMKYTLDNSDPTKSPTAQIAMSRATVSVKSTETITAYAYAPGYQPSPTVSAVYTFVSTAPVSTGALSPNNALSAIIGPVTPFGTSPWPWYDLAAKGNADDVPAAALAYTPAVGPQAAGTFTLADGCNITLSGSGASEFAPGEFAVVAWNTVDGPGTGRLVFLIQSKNGNTLTSANQCGLLNIPAATGLSVYHCDAGCAAYTSTYSCTIWGVCNLNGDSWGFYDPALALYRMYLRTNNAKYLNSFRSFTDIWWTWAIDHGGKVINPPRGFSLASQFVRALDGHAERFPALYEQLKLSFDSQLLTEIDGQDNREPGYMLLFAAVGARADPDPTRHAWYCSAVESHVQLWMNAQRPDGYWSEKNNFYAYVVPGVSPWRLFSILQGLARAYDVLIDTSAAGCNNPALAGRDLTAIEAATNFAYQYGYDPQSRGVFYDVQHPNDGEDGTNQGTMPGSVSISMNSSSVAGLNTTFRKTFACNGTDYIGITDPGGLTWTHLVSSCSDDNHLTLATPWGSQCVETGSVVKGVGTSCATANITGGQYYQTPPAFTSCRNLATSCWPNVGDRNSNRDLIWIHGWLYNTTRNPIYQTRGDELFAASYGGPAAGPGFNYPNSPGPCGGPSCDGVDTDYVAAIHGCASNPTLPCNPDSNYPGGNAYVFTSKRWGQGSGIGGADNYLAWRTLSLRPTGATRLAQ